METDNAPAARPADSGLVDALVQSAFRVVAELTRIAAIYDLSLTQVRVLGILRDRERVRIGDLGAHLGLERSTLSGLVDRAEQRGLVERLPDEADRRAIAVALTDDGAVLAHRLAAVAVDRISPVYSVLDGRQRRDLQDLLERTLAD